MTAAVRTRAFVLLRLATNLGMAIGPAVGGVLALHHSLVVLESTCHQAFAQLDSRVCLRTPVGGRMELRSHLGRT